jgi:hypothetical protein
MSMSQTFNLGSTVVIKDPSTDSSMSQDHLSRILDIFRRYSISQYTNYLLTAVTFNLSEDRFLHQELETSEFSYTFSSTLTPDGMAFIVEAQISVIATSQDEEDFEYLISFQYFNGSAGCQDIKLSIPNNGGM